MFKKFFGAVTQEFVLASTLAVLGLFVAVFVKIFWNLSIPELFGAKEITWIQAWSLYMLVVVALRLLPWKAP